jgi:hypothetical protein
MGGIKPGSSDAVVTAQSQRNRAPTPEDQATRRAIGHHYAVMASWALAEFCPAPAGRFAFCVVAA